MSLKCIPNSVLKCIVNKFAHNITKRNGGIHSQVRYNSSAAESQSKAKVKPIPYVNPNFKHRPGGKLLLVIPAITFGLGTWQLKRLKWKEELIRNMEERQRKEPVPLTLDPDEIAKSEFCRVQVKGRFDHSNELFYGPKSCFVDGEVKRDVVHPSGQESLGYNLVVPFILSDSGERILVNRGWIRTKMIKKKDRQWSNTKGEEVTIEGVIRHPEPRGMFGPKNDERYNIWHYRLIDEIADKFDCLPIWIDATDQHSIPGKLWAGQTVMKIRNEHLQYAITWYSLSFLTAFMYYLNYIKR